MDPLCWRSPVRAIFGPCFQTRQVRDQIFAVIGDRLAVHSRGTVPADSPVGFEQPQLIHVMTQRGERAARMFPRHCCDVLLAR